MEKKYVWSSKRGVRKLKADANFEAYQQKYSDAIQICNPPSMATMEKWIDNCTATAIDGCGKIEPDGICQHGYPSWLLALGYI